MAKKSLTEGASLCEKTICPSPEELSVIANNVICEQCGLVFRNKPRYRLHDLKVHQRKNLDKTAKENVRYHCPVQSCVYAVNSQRYFSTMKYLKQHYLKVHAEKTHACNRCNKSFSTEAAKEGHMRVCGIEFTCSCLKTYTTYEALLTHAKRSLHAVTEKYKSSLRRTNSKTMRIILPTGRINKLVTILPSPDKFGRNSENVDTRVKSTSDIGVQTDDYKRSRKISSPPKLNNNHSHCNPRRRISKQTQTNSFNRERSSSSNSNSNSNSSSSSSSSSSGRSMETQTTTEVHKRVLPSKQSEQQHALLKEELNLGDNFASANLFPASPLPLRHDVGLQDFWEEKNTSGTQTIPEKDMFEAFNDNVTQTEFETLYEHSRNPLIQCVPKSNVALMTLPYVESYPFVSAETGISSQVDPLLIGAKATAFDDRFSSIETQTEQAFSSSYFYSESLSRSFALSSNIETQTTDNLDNMEQLLYSNTCTQTCSEMLSSDLGLMSNIQTQTAWSHDDTTVSTETQTKSLICEAGCNIPMGACRSWLNTQTSHTETQTDLLSIFEGLQ